MARRFSPPRAAAGRRALGTGRRAPLRLAWWIIAFGGGASEDPTFLGRIYIGYAVTPQGSAIGLAWGFVDALIAGAIFAWLYNLIAAKLSPGAG